jgi:hypothetical protein
MRRPREAPLARFKGFHALAGDFELIVVGAADQLVLAKEPQAELEVLDRAAEHFGEITASQGGRMRIRQSLGIEQPQNSLPLAYLRLNALRSSQGNRRF